MALPSGRGCEDNEVVSFTDLLSKITRTGTELPLKGNKAKQIGSTFSKLAPVDNYLNTAIDPSQEAALVAALAREGVHNAARSAHRAYSCFSGRFLPAQAQKDAVRAALASIGAI